MKQMNMEQNKSTGSDDKKIIDGNVYNYCSIEDALCESHRITNKKTGITVELDSDQKLIYMRMRKRFHFFDSIDKSFYDNVDVLADAAGIDLRKFYRKKKGLIEVGLIVQDDSLKSNSYTVSDLTPEDFLLERKHRKLGWINCLDCPALGNKHPQEPHKAEEQETEAVTETSPIEPQQPATKSVLPSYDEDIPDFARTESHCEQQKESPTDDNCASPSTSKMKLVMTELHLEDFDDDYEKEDKELEDWEVIDEKLSPEKKLSPIRKAMRDQLCGKGKGKRSDYTEHIDF